jgi:hypothetical protein
MNVNNSVHILAQVIDNSANSSGGEMDGHPLKLNYS